jgi:hypothetical protein
MAIIVGDLVCMYRRKIKGMGIILEKIEDVADLAGIDSGSILRDLGTIEGYTARIKYKNEVVESATDPDAARLFLSFNAQGWCSKPKHRFARVKWFKHPSNYENTKISDEVAWYPADWLKKV